MEVLVDTVKNQPYAIPVDPVKLLNELVECLLGLEEEFLQCSLEEEAAVAAEPTLSTSSGSGTHSPPSCGDRFSSNWTQVSPISDSRGEDPSLESEEEISEMDLPAGLMNLGNTCYMNATVQCLKTVPELRQALKKFDGGVSISNNLPAQSITGALRDLYSAMDKGPSIAPFTLQQAMHMAFPRFAEKEDSGNVVQQDAHECWLVMIRMLQQTLPAVKLDGEEAQASFTSVIDQFFGVQFDVEMKCTEAPEEPPNNSSESFLYLSCYISTEVKYMMSGLNTILQEQITKHSPTLNRDAQYLKASKVKRLPAYLTVQFVRYDIENAKILNDVKFPIDFDAIELCSPELQQKLIPMRTRFKEQEDKELEDATNLKKVGPLGNRKKKEGKKEPNWFPEDLGSNNSGLYTLQAVLTHQGSSSSSGHYVAWVRQSSRGDTWLMCDDAQVSPVTTEDILKLSGGGDRHCAYVLLYGPRILETPLEEESAPTAMETAPANNGVAASNADGAFHHVFYKTRCARRYCMGCKTRCVGEALMVENMIFHIDCFNCTVCKNSLAKEKFSSKDTVGIEIKTKFGKTCVVQGEVILVKDQLYHNKCFTCARCRQVIMSGEIVTTGKEVLCTKCSPIPVRETQSLQSNPTSATATAPRVELSTIFEESELGEPAGGDPSSGEETWTEAKGAKPKTKTSKLAMELDVRRRTQSCVGENNNISDYLDGNKSKIASKARTRKTTRAATIVPAILVSDADNSNADNKTTDTKIQSQKTGDATPNDEEQQFDDDEEMIIRSRAIKKKPTTEKKTKDEPKKKNENKKQVSPAAGIKRKPGRPPKKGQPAHLRPSNQPKTTSPEVNHSELTTT